MPLSKRTKYQRCNPASRLFSSVRELTGKTRSKSYAPKIESTSSVDGIPDRVEAPTARIFIVWSRISVISGTNLTNNSPSAAPSGITISGVTGTTGASSFKSLSLQAPANSANVVIIYIYFLHILVFEFIFFLEFREGFKILVEISRLVIKPYHFSF